MKKIIWGIALLFSTSMVAGAHTCCHNSAQKCGCKRGYYTQYYGDKPELIKEAIAWAESGIWRNGFDKAKPHSSVNLADFYLQYQKNPQQWQALFDYLAKTDLLSIPKGKQQNFPKFAPHALFAIIPRAMPWARSFWAFSPFLNHMLKYNTMILK